MMRKMLSLLLALVFCVHPMRAQTGTTPPGDSNTPEEVERLKYIFKKLLEFKLMALPVMMGDIKHFNELHHTGVNVRNYAEQYQKMYPRTSRYVDEQLWKRNGTGKSVATAPVAALGARAVWTGIKDFLFVVGIYAWYNSEQEQNIYNDLLDQGFQPDVAEREANYQSDRAANIHANYPSAWLIVTVAEALELFTEANDRSRYNVEEYILRTLAGPLRPLSPGSRTPISVGGDGAGMFIGTPGPGGGCVVFGPGPMPGGPPSTGLPGFEDEITVVGTPLPPC